MPTKPTNRSDEEKLGEFLAKVPKKAPVAYRKALSTQHTMVAGVVTSVCIGLGSYAGTVIPLLLVTRPSLLELVQGLFVTMLATVFVGLIGQAVALMWVLRLGSNFINLAGSLLLTAGSFLIWERGDVTDRDRDGIDAAAVSLLSTAIFAVLFGIIAGPLGVVSMWNLPESSDDAKMGSFFYIPFLGGLIGMFVAMAMCLRWMQLRRRQAKQKKKAA